MLAPKRQKFSLLQFISVAIQVMDTFSKQQRSAIMRAVASRNTSPELAVRRLAHGLGFRFRVNVKSLPGTPDIAIKSRSKVVFVHGCFWHRHPRCKRASIPASNHKYWEEKFARNVARDKRTLAEYRKMGWSPLVIWECELKSPDQVCDRLKKYLGK